MKSIVLRILKKGSRYMAALLLLTALFSACKKDTPSATDEDPATGNSSNGQIDIGGMQRTYTLYIPDGVPAQSPLLIVLHGDGGTGAGIQGYTHFEQIADEEKFIVVYPDAINGLWQKEVNPGENSDVTFINELVIKLMNEQHIDNHKVYATGHSGGAFFCYTLAMKTESSRIAAIAPYAGNMYGDEAFINNYFANTYVQPGYKQKAICHMQGDADNTVDYPDPNHAPDDWGEWPLSGFSYASCGTATYTATEDIVPGKVQRLVFCPGGDAGTKKIEIVRLIGQGHDWPAIAGFDTEQYIWDFLKAYNTY